VRQNGGEEQEAGDHSRYPDRADAPVRMQSLKPRGQRKRDENGNDDPRLVKPNFDAEYLAKSDLRLHTFLTDSFPSPSFRMQPFHGTRKMQCCLKRCLHRI
jgi:hypothetical protein